MRNVMTYLMGVVSIVLFIACNDASDQISTREIGSEKSGSDSQLEYSLNNSEKSYVIIQSYSDEIAGSDLTKEDDSLRTVWVREQVQKIKRFNALFSYQGLKISSVQYNDHDEYSTLIAVRGFNTLKPAIDYSELFISEMDESFKSLFEYVAPITYSDYRKSMDAREIDKYCEYYSNLKKRK